jgi:hypothetical protein
MKIRQIYFRGLAFAACIALGACSWIEDDPGGSEDDSKVTVSPSSVTLAKGTSQQFTAEESGSSYSSFSWSLEGDHATGTTISSEGLLTVDGNENARSFKVKAALRYDSDTSGTAQVTIAAEGELPSNTRITRPGKTSIGLTWSPVENAGSYKVYRSANGKDYSHLADIAEASYSDTAIAAGSSYYYRVSAVVKGSETGKSSPAFSFAEEYFALPVFSGRRLVPLTGGQKHYYRFPVTAGQSYTVTWEDGSSKNADYYVRCSAWQNDGTEIFSNAYYGYDSPKVFTATVTGHVIVEVQNANDSARYNYMAYCLITNGESDAGVVALPPAPVTGMRVTSPSPSTITLAWDSVAGATGYNIYRAPTRTAALGLIGSSAAASFLDTSVAANASYYYALAAVNADGREGVQIQGTFAFAVLHYGLPSYSGGLINLPGGQKHYFRLPVTAGQGYTITWQNGSSQNADYYVRCSAWQNDGTEIFSNAYYGYDSPKVFTATVTGYVTVEVRNASSSTAYDYQIYH